MPDLATDLSFARTALKAELAAYRYDFETGGRNIFLDVPGVPTGFYPVDTSRESYGMITGTLESFADLSFTFIKWKLRDGTFLEMDKVAFIVLAHAVRDHVRWCFAAEAEVATAIDAAADVLDLDIEAMFETEYAALNPGA